MPAMHPGERRPYKRRGDPSGGDGYARWMGAFLGFIFAVAGGG